MKYVSSLSYIDICKLFHHKKIHFISDCDFFPDFNIECLVLDIFFNQNHSEILIKVKILKNNKILTIGSNMKNLQYELL